MVQPLLRSCPYQIIAITLALILVIVSAIPALDAPTGCSMVGCDFAQTGDSKLPLPPTKPSVAWTIGVQSYSPSNPGCASNGRAILCNAINNGQNILGSWDGFTGQPRWNVTLPTSNTVPYIGGAGDGVAVDKDYLAYILSYGQESWKLSLTNSGPFFSPSYTTFADNFAVVFLTFADGHIVTRGMDASPGGSIYLNATFKGQSGIFQPLGAPPSRPNRFYVSTRFCPDKAGTGLDVYGRLYAIDVQLSLQERIKVIWTYDYVLPQPLAPSTTCPTSPAYQRDAAMEMFGNTGMAVNPSTGRISAIAPGVNNSVLIIGSQPTSDSSSNAMTKILVITDINDAPQVTHHIPLTSEPSSIAISSHGSATNYTTAWLTWPASDALWRVDLVHNKLELLNVSTILQQKVTITSRITIARPKQGALSPVLVFAATTATGQSLIVALDASHLQPKPLWTVAAPAGSGSITGQLSIISDGVIAPLLIVQATNAIIAFR